ncbi:hypothetical protein IWW38_002988 [Coemansia aciculifera]|uniref:Uncharacterized protein n=1 Tax=Coemansia aciculifera TaxID=417176 RepID=A0ACC1M2R0_9FUNG|nr:hypothetical protein IWW38_002988 [Coemansia aciculifera]
MSLDDHQLKQCVEAVMATIGPALTSISAQLERVANNGGGSQAGGDPAAMDLTGDSDQGSRGANCGAGERGPHSLTSQGDRRSMDQGHEFAEDEVADDDEGGDSGAHRCVPFEDIDVAQLATFVSDPAKTKAPSWSKIREKFSPASVDALKYLTHGVDVRAEIERVKVPNAEIELKADEAWSGALTVATYLAAAVADISANIASGDSEGLRRAMQDMAYATQTLCTALMGERERQRNAHLKKVAKAIPQFQSALEESTAGDRNARDILSNATHYKFSDRLERRRALADAAKIAKLSRGFTSGQPGGKGGGNNQSNGYHKPNDQWQSNGKKQQQQRQSGKSQPQQQQQNQQQQQSKSSQ